MGCSRTDLKTMAKRNWKVERPKLDKIEHMNTILNAITQQVEVHEVHNEHVVMSIPLGHVSCTLAGAASQHDYFTVHSSSIESHHQNSIQINKIFISKIFIPILTF